MSSLVRILQLFGGMILALLVTSCLQNEQSGTVPPGQATGKADYVSEELLPPVPEDVFLIRNGDFTEGLEQWTVVPSSSNGTRGIGQQGFGAFEMEEGGELSDCVQLQVGQKEAEIKDKDGVFDYGTQQGAVLIQRFRVEEPGAYSLSTKIAATYKGARNSDRNGYGGLFILRVRTESAEGSKVVLVGDLGEVKDPAEAEDPVETSEIEGDQIEGDIEGDQEEQTQDPAEGETEPVNMYAGESEEVSEAASGEETSSESEGVVSESETPSEGEEVVSEGEEVVSEGEEVVSEGEAPAVEPEVAENILGEAQVVASHDFKILNSEETKRHTLQGEVELAAGIYRVELFVTRLAKSTKGTPLQYIDEVQISPLFDPVSDELLPEDVVPVEEEE